MILTADQGEIRVCRARVCEGIRQGGAWPDVDWTTGYIGDSRRAKGLIKRRPWM